MRFGRFISRLHDVVREEWEAHQDVYCDEACILVEVYDRELKEKSMSKGNA